MCHWGGPVAYTDHSQAQNQYIKRETPSLKAHFLTGTSVRVSEQRTVTV